MPESAEMADQLAVRARLEGPIKMNKSDFKQQLKEQSQSNYSRAPKIHNSLSYM